MSINNLERPSWDTWFISMAYMARLRSPDPHTKHGAIIVDNNHKVVSLGYNGHVQDIDDSKVPITRPAKYFYKIHAEENCVFAATESLKDCTAYITGIPCSRCFWRLARVGISKIVYGDITSKCIDEQDELARNHMLELINESKPGRMTLVKYEGQILDPQYQKI